MNNWQKRFLLFLLFGSLYFLIETIFKHHLSHWSMFLIGGLSGVLIGEINEYLPWNLSFWYQCLIGTGMVTLLEGTSGYVLNIIYDLHIWDYSNLKYTFFFGQCSWLFCGFWFILSGICIFLDDWLRWKFFHEEPPHYNFKLKNF